MSQQIYLNELVGRLEEDWRPPHRRPLRGGEPSGTAIRPDVLQAVLDSVFFASLRTEEGHHHCLALVLVESTRQLTELYPPWRVHRFISPLSLDADRLIKLAPTLNGGKRFLIVRTDGAAPMIVGTGDAREEDWLWSEDEYPRVLVIGPGDMVFYRGGGALFRYRAGVIEELHPDFFTSGDEPRDAMQTMGQRLFPSWSRPEDPSEVRIIIPFLANLIEHIAQIGHGGMLAVLAPDEADGEEVRNACAYAIEPLDLGEALVSDHEGERGVEQTDPRSTSVPALQRMRTNAEFAQEAEPRDTHDTVESHIQTVAGMAAVDGAVLLTHDLRVLGFGCKLPGLNGAAPRVLRAPASLQAEAEEYDLTLNGTRHTSAALFAAARPGRMAFTVSADGPAACFMWSTRLGTVVHWPVHVGAFAPQVRW